MDSENRMNQYFRLQYKYVNIINKIKTIAFIPIYMYLNVTCPFSLKTSPIH